MNTQVEEMLPLIKPGTRHEFKTTRGCFSGIVLERNDGSLVVLTETGVKKTIANDEILGIAVSKMSEINAAIMKEYFDAYQLYTDSAEQMAKAKKIKDFSRSKMHEAAFNLRPESLINPTTFCKANDMSIKGYYGLMAKLKEEKLFLNPVKFCKEAGMNIVEYEAFMAELQETAQMIFDEKVAGVPSGSFFPVDELLADVEGEQMQLFVIQLLKKKGVEFWDNSTTWRY